MSNQSCATCRFAKWELTPKGRIVAGSAGECLYPTPEIPPVPAAVLVTLSRASIRPADGVKCPCYSQALRVPTGKLSATQLAVLSALASGRVLHRSNFVRCSSQWFDDPHESVSMGTVDSLVSRKLIVYRARDWRGGHFVLTDAGRDAAPSHAHQSSPVTPQADSSPAAAGGVA